MVKKIENLRELAKTQKIANFHPGKLFSRCKRLAGAILAPITL